MCVVETMYNVFSFYNFIFTTNTCQMEAIESIELDYQCLPIMHNLCNDKLLNTTVIVLLHPVLNHHITIMKNLTTKSSMLGNFQQFTSILEA